ncbi:MAG: gliding motility-associated C-terminal domain-containing protein [Bacteroidota bacterium]|nr:gliding motility-associated C-terminal domain-containing protein [Bacteroidota bacterium]
MSKLPLFLYQMGVMNMNILMKHIFTVLLIITFCVLNYDSNAQNTLGCVPADLANQNICQNSIISFQASVKPGISGYSWTVSKLIGGEVVASSSNAAFTLNGFPTANELYLIIVTADSSGTPVSRNYGYLPINPSPPVDLGNDIILCPNFNATLSSPSSPTSSGYTYEWKLLPNTTLSGATSITVNSQGSYQLNVKDNSNGCNRSDVVNIIPKNKPDITAISSSGFPVRCPGKPLGLDVRINVNTETPYSYSWTPNFSISNTAIKNPSVTNNIPQTYQIIFSDVNNCRDTSTIFVRLNPPLNVSTNFKDSIVCKFSTLDLKSSPSGGTQYAGLNKYKYSWSPKIGMNDSTLTTPTISPISVSGIKYTVVAIDSNNCTASDTVWVKKSALSMSIKNFAQDSLAVCRFSSFELTAGRQKGTAPFSYTWSPDAYLKKINDSTYFVNAIDKDTSIYVTIKDGKNCTDIDNIKIGIIPATLPRIVDKTSYLCGNESKKVDVTPLSNIPGEYTYLWSPSVGLSANNIPNPTIITTSKGVITTYSITVTSTVTGCKASDQMIVETKALPQISINDVPGTPYIKDAISLSANGDAGLNYVWQIQGYTNQSGQSIIQVFDSVKTYQIVLTATDQFTCKGYDTLNLRLYAYSKDKIYIPDTFSPNAQSAENTSFRIFADDNDIDLNSEFDAKIFARTGQLIFQTKSYQDMKTTGWNGDGFSPGVYSYLIKWVSSNGKTHAEKGHIKLIK